VIENVYQREIEDSLFAETKPVGYSVHNNKMPSESIAG